jgi:hypothetical protein
MRQSLRNMFCFAEDDCVGLRFEFLGAAFPVAVRAWALPKKSITTVRPVGPKIVV